MINQTISFVLHYPFHLIVGGVIAAVVFGVISLVVAAIGKEKSSFTVGGAYVFYGLMYLSGGVVAITIFINISFAVIVFLSSVIYALQT